MRPRPLNFALSIVVSSSGPAISATNGALTTSSFSSSTRKNRARVFNSDGGQASFSAFAASPVHPLSPLKARSHGNAEGVSPLPPPGEQSARVRRPVAVSARIVNVNVGDKEYGQLCGALNRAGFQSVLPGDGGGCDDGTLPACSNREVVQEYSFSVATGMLKWIGTKNAISVTEEAELLPEVDQQRRSGGGKQVNAYTPEPPRYVPMVRGEDEVLISNGWGFLDPDDSEPLSSFDVGDANREGSYRPKWAMDDVGSEHRPDDDEEEEIEELDISSIGYSVKKMTSGEILDTCDKDIHSRVARGVLLEGDTEPRNAKSTHNGYSFAGTLDQSTLTRGVFCCAVGNLPLFSSADLSPSTASSGWLTFVRPVAEDHIKLVQNEAEGADDRIEVLCARTGCHLGHYFGQGDGYCINACALNFYPVAGDGVMGAVDGGDEVLPMGASPTSWRSFEESSSERPSRSLQLLDSLLRERVKPETVAFGAGCFWHVEFALRRLPGVISTEVGYAGGTVPSPTYEQVCELDTGHAEVVRVTFDADVCPRRTLMDCFLAMHDPTVVRAHGKRSRRGQYRSCVFVTSREMEDVAKDALGECSGQLQKVLSTYVTYVHESSAQSECRRWFWRAEDRHQLHDERVKHGRKTHTIGVREWLREYARRSASIWGSARTMELAMDDPRDDGTARMMI